MEFKVRALDSAEEKGVQQTEKELLEKHEQEQTETNNEQSDVQNDVQNAQSNGQNYAADQEDDLSEDKVLSYIGKRYNKQINSFDELMAERKESEVLPEDVAAYMKYKKETGRGFEDFIKLNKDYDSMDSDELLKAYLSSTQNGLDADDIDTLMEEYRYDEDLDDESSVKKIKIAKKKAVAEAKNFFNSQKEKYKVPLESRGAFQSDEDKEEYEAYKQYTTQSKTIEEENQRKRKWFEQKTNEVFDNGFKGFEFKVNDKSIVFSPGEAMELKKNQLTPNTFISKFLDDSGLIKDAEGYHKSLSIAMNPDRFAKFFYEQGLADATDDIMRKSKNINMTERSAPQVMRPNDGVQVRAVNPDSGKSLKIRSIKKI
jgi:hypothetical protein